MFYVCTNVVCLFNVLQVDTLPNCKFKTIGMALQIVSNNVKGLRQKQKRADMFYFFKQRNYDIILLQETHSIETDVHSWQNEWNGDIYLSHGRSNSAGVAILLKPGIMIKEYQEILNGKIQMIKINISNTVLAIINIYAPNLDSEQIIFFEEIRSMLLKEDMGRLVIAGDFNIVLNQDLDKLGGNKVKRKSLFNVKAIIDDFNLIDIWRHRHPNRKDFTWSQNKPRVQCRLDYFLISRGLIKRLKNTKIFWGIRSDHKCIDLSLKKEDSQRGPGFWKLNSQLLSEDEYKVGIRKVIGNVYDNPEMFRDSRMTFDFLKFKIMEFSINYSKARKQSRLKEEKDCIQRLEQLNDRVAIGIKHYR